MHCYFDKFDKKEWFLIRPVFQNICSFKTAMSQVNLLVNLFSKLYVTFIFQWIAFIFGRDEEEDQKVFHVEERQLSFFIFFLKNIMPLDVFLV